VFLLLVAARVTLDVTAPHKPAMALLLHVTHPCLVASPATQQTASVWSHTRAITQATPRPENPHSEAEERVPYSSPWWWRLFAPRKRRIISTKLFRTSQKKKISAFWDIEPCSLVRAASIIRAKHHTRLAGLRKETYNIRFIMFILVRRLLEEHQTRLVGLRKKNYTHVSLRSQ
jgi:hypothetical protein